MFPIPLSPDESFHFELLRTLSLARYTGADISEVLTAASAIAPGDFESFSAAFAALAQHILLKIEELIAPVSLRDALFRVSTYFRAADFYLHGNPTDPRIMEYWEKQTECFGRAIGLLPVPGRRDVVRLPEYGIPLLIFCASDDDAKRPTIVMGNGFDGAMEEMYHQYGIAALERGYNVVYYEGPGQCSVRRYQNLGFTHEWEKVVSPVLDYLETLQWVDMTAIGLIGNSMGALLAARAAAFNHRIVVVFCIDGLYDLNDTQMGRIGELAGLEGGFDLQKFVMDSNFPTTIRWAVSHGMWAFKVATSQEFSEKIKPWTLEGIVQKIECPVFVADAESDIFFQGQAERLRDELGDDHRATYHKFTDEDAAGAHCHMGAFTYLNQVIYDWFETM